VLERRAIEKLCGSLIFCLLCCTALAAQDPKATAVGGIPFFIKQTWIIGGDGNWDYLTLDPVALQLFVAHEKTVQVVDVNAGSVVGQVTGLRDAHGIALSDDGALGFVSDGPANQVKVFDRRSFSVIASVPTGPNPRAVVYEPLTKLVFAICTQPVGDNYGLAASTNRSAQAETARKSTGRPAPVNPNSSSAISVVTVIDAETQKPLGNLLLPGKLGFALADGRGEVFISIVDRNRIAHFDAQSLLSEIHQQPTTGASAPIIDWSGRHTSAGQGTADSRLQTFRLGAACQDPVGLAVDGNHLRLFAACDNQKMQVLNTGTGEVVATLPIGAGTDAIGYDPQRGLIFTSNGGGLGSVTVIRQDVADSYNVIQELPTKQRARTLAVNPTNGEVYLVTNLEGFDLNQKGVGGTAHTLPVVQAEAVKGSFQVLVIGN
jgi:DNA-binding beta-propeller fold protein YncE